MMQQDLIGILLLVRKKIHLLLPFQCLWINSRAVRFQDIITDIYLGNQPSLPTPIYLSQASSLRHYEPTR